MVDLFLFVFCFLLLPFLLILCKKNGNSANDRSKASQASMEESGTESEQPSVVISCITLREDDSKMGKVSEIKETKSQRQLTATERCAMEAALNVQHMNKEYPKFEEYCKTHRCVREPEMAYKNTTICKTCHNGVMWRCLGRFYLHHQYLKEGIVVNDTEGTMKKFEEKLPKFGWKWTGADFVRIKRIKQVEPTQQTEEEAKPQSKQRTRGTKSLIVEEYENLGPLPETVSQRQASRRGLPPAKNPYENMGPSREKSCRTVASCRVRKTKDKDDPTYEVL